MAVIELDADSTTPSSDEEAAALVGGGLDDFVGYITEDEDDIVDLATLLGASVAVTDSSDTSDVDSQSETEGAEEVAEGTEEEAQGDSEEGPAAETEDAPADEAEGDSSDAENSPPEEEAPKQKAVPPESKGMRVLRESHKFRVAVEPVIKDYADELPEVVGIAAAVRTGVGEDALKAIFNYSESAANNLKSHVLEAEAEGYIAQKFGVTPEALATMLKEAPEAPEALKAEMEYLSDEARAELEGLLRQPALATAKDAAKDAEIKSLKDLVVLERRGAVEAALDWKFNELTAKAKLTGDPKELVEIATPKIRANEKADKALKDAFNFAEKGQKNDAARSMKDFYRELSSIVKDMAASQRPAAPAPAVEVPTPKAPKAPVMKPETLAKTKVAQDSKAQSAAAVGKYQPMSDADFLKMARAKAKSFGIGWKD